MDLWLKHLNAQPFATKPGSAKLWTDSDVRDFEKAASLWDKAPLQEKTDFTKNPEPDTPLKNEFFKRFPEASKALGIQPNTPGLTQRDLEWSLIDPDGA